jgi:excisionase family DNA binding protein
MLDIEDRFYTSTEVAEILGVSLRSIYRYLEEGKIHAEVKTATGRHRFTKQNILDFLQPQDERVPAAPKPAPAPATPEPVQQVPATVPVQPVLAEAPAEAEVASAEPATQTPAEETSEKAETPVAETPAAEETPQAVETSETPTPESTQTPVEEAPKAETTEDKDSVDWLEKFKAAAAKHKEEQAAETPAAEKVAETPASTPAPTPAPEAPKAETPAKPAPPVESVSGLGTETPVEKAPVAEEKSGPYNYYKSAIGGLKDIAQNLDKSAKKASLDYAFTMNAGLSLHKPIKPFSLLHAYIRGQDKDFYEKVLKLTPTAKDSAQLCLIVSDENSVYETRKELHGLHVVTDVRLKADLASIGEEDLAKELDK